MSHKILRRFIVKVLGYFPLLINKYVLYNILLNNNIHYFNISTIKFKFKLNINNKT